MVEWVEYTSKFKLLQLFVNFVAFLSPILLIKPLNVTVFVEFHKKKVCVLAIEHIGVLWY